MLIESIDIHTACPDLEAQLRCAPAQLLERFRVPSPVLEEPIPEVTQLVHESLGALATLELFSRDECNELIESATASTAWRTGSTKKLGVDTSIRVAQGLNERDDAQPFIRTRARLVERLLPFVGDDLFLSGLNVVRYTPGGFYVPHADASFENFQYRRFSFVCYLSEDFEGGKTSFPRLGYAFRGRPGEALMFPSRYIHCGERVGAGEKWILQFYLMDETNPYRGLSAPAVDPTAGG